MFKPSIYQKNIYSFITSSTGNAIIQAVAGSGKTTTIIEATKLIPNTKKSIFVAFNKSIADELRQRLPHNIEARTLHSFGLGLFSLNCNCQPKVEGDKLDSIITSVLNDEIGEDDKLYGYYFGIVKKVSKLIKIHGIDYKKFEEVNDIMMENDVEYELDEKVFDLVNNIMEKNNKQIDIIDFDDMIYLPIVNNFKSHTYDWVFVDELQDCNRTQNELIKKMCNNKTRIIGVGDRSQSIYAFRGADTNSMDNFKEYFKAKELPLSISYRCPKKVVELAKEIVPQIECRDDAEDGIVEDTTFDKLISNTQSGDMVLCRTNAPLVTVAFTLIRNGKKAVIRGRDIGRNLIKIIDKYKVVNLEDLIGKINHFQELQLKKIEMIEKGELNKKKKNSILTEIDGCECILIMSEDVETIQELKNKIESIFTDEKVGIVCSTIHKAKGLESDVVYIVNYDMIPHPMAKTEIEIQQEMNIKYVAITRSKRELYLISKI